MIVFFPSYSIINKFLSLCNQRDLLKILSNIKDIFIEPQLATEIPALLKSFMNSCDKVNSKGAIILAVVNGKVSEGINFSDHYGRYLFWLYSLRAVILCGLPFPDQRSSEINEMVKFLQTNPVYLKLIILIIIERFFNSFKFS